MGTGGGRGTGYARETLRWNGWGRRNEGFDLGSREDAVWDWIAGTLGMARLVPHPAKRLDVLTLPPPRLDAGALAAFTRIVGRAHVRTDDRERAFHARGHSLIDLIRLRGGDIESVPDAVIYPGSAGEVAKAIALAGRRRIAVVPFGGGSSVVGGVEPRPDRTHKGAITLDLTRLDKFIALDEPSRTATFEAGIYGPPLEAALAARGTTLGHFPQSFEFSTLGGWIAARGAGQLSQRYGKAEDWLVAARLATPSGSWSTESFPASAAGPDLRQLVAGSEGTLGVITEATVRIHELPAARDYRAYLFRDFARGAAAARRLSQDDLPLAMIRLSDGDETRFLSAFAAAGRKPGRLERAARAIVRARGYGEGACVMLVGAEGGRRQVAATRRACRAICRAEGALSLGRGPGRRWLAGRFRMPYLRDPLLDRGVGVETLETATRWSNVGALRARVSKSIARALKDTAAGPKARALVMCHVSHCYPDGASLYFTFVYPIDRRRAERQWRAVKRAAGEAIVTGGGTISHHHGVGTDHAAFMGREKGQIGLDVLRAIKARLDPDGIMNPGKLLGG